MPRFGAVFLSNCKKYNVCVRKIEDIYCKNVLICYNKAMDSSKQTKKEEKITWKICFGSALSVRLSPGFSP